LLGFSFPVSAEAYYLYVTDGYQNKLVVIDSAAVKNVKEIATENSPFDLISAEKNGKELIILSFANNKGIWIIDPVTYKIEKKVPLPGKGDEPAGYFHIAYNPVYKKLYAVSRTLKKGYVFDSDWRHIKTIELGEWPSGVAISPDGRYVYVTNMISKNVSVINSEDDKIERTIKLNGLPNAIAISPDGKYLYVTDEENFKLFIIDSKSEKTVKELLIGIAPRGITVTPDGRYIYISNLDSFNVTAVDANKMEVMANIPVSSLPWGIASSPDSKRIFVCNYYENSISVIDTSTNKEIERINGAVFPTKIAVSRGK
jgi:YVTN family beta-propeller protein